MRPQRKTLQQLAIITVATISLIFVYLLWPMSSNPGAASIPYTPSETVGKYGGRNAILLINTGSPARLDKPHVRQFIGDMLSDRYVMGLPEWFGNILARKIIAPMRASSSLAKYSLIWGDSLDSPLTLTTLALGRDIEQKMQQPTATAMRYVGLSPHKALSDLLDHYPRTDSITLLPLFPQYAESSYLTAVESARAAAQQLGLTINVAPAFYNHPDYITALADKIRANTQHGFQKLVFSFHSLPMSHVERGRLLGPEFDYEYQCNQTARLTAQQLGLSDDRYMVVYASAIGRNWLEPNLDQVIEALPQSGYDSIAIVAPGFVIDNLETLYDLNINARSIFTAAGGKQFSFVPCLNQDFAAAAAAIIRSHE